jgi:hypothetical protein
MNRAVSQSWARRPRGTTKKFSKVLHFRVGGNLRLWKAKPAIMAWACGLVKQPG